MYMCKTTRTKIFYVESFRMKNEIFPFKEVETTIKQGESTRFVVFSFRIMFLEVLLF